jgi:Protein of unknown function (DUF2934)
MTDQDLHERIKRRAYLLWQQEGRPEGQPRITDTELRLRPWRRGAARAAQPLDRQSDVISYDRSTEDGAAPAARRSLPLTARERST